MFNEYIEVWKRNPNKIRWDGSRKSMIQGRRSKVVVAIAACAVIIRIAWEETKCFVQS